MSSQRFLKVMGVVVLVSVAVGAQARSIFNLAPDRTTVSVISGSSTDLVTTVTNNTSHTYTDIRFGNKAESGAGVTASTVSGGTCVSEDSLAAGASCTFITRFQSSVVGSATYRLDFCGANGFNCSRSGVVTVTTAASGVTVTGAVTTPLPARTQKDTGYTVLFTFTNASASHAATGVSVTTSPSLTSVTNTCSSGTLAASGSCTYGGTYTPTAVGANTLTATLTADNASDVELTTTTLTGLVYLPNSAFLRKCFFDSDTGLFSQCENAGYQQSNNDNTDAAIFNPAGSMVYVSVDEPYSATPTQFQSWIDHCDIESDGCLISCSDTGARGLSNPHGIAFNQTGDTLYAANLGAALSSTDVVSKCSVDGDGDLSCADSGATGADAAGDIVLDADNSRAYITNTPDDNIVRCTIDGSGDLGSCTANVITSGSVTCPMQLSFNADKSRVYLGQGCNTSNTQIFTCAAASGEFSSCAAISSPGSTPFAFPIGVAFNAGTSDSLIVASANFNTPSIQTCAISGATLSSCVDSGASVSFPAYVNL
ncbi:MAG: beta-propeller fold lactonase family protein [Coxiellaceae bacterium]|nr:beta-propeller fold lactonase family protein [Coxiellaceae bacterium]